MGVSRFDMAESFRGLRSRSPEAADVPGPPARPYAMYVSKLVPKSLPAFVAMGTTMPSCSVLAFDNWNARRLARTGHRSVQFCRLDPMWIRLGFSAEFSRADACEFGVM
jgi:hypothetical protein